MGLAFICPALPTCLVAVVCLWGGEEGTCLGPPLFGGPLEVLRV